MQFGIFDHMDRSGEDLPQQYEDRLRLIEAYDRAGFRGYHLAEHHCTPLGLSPSPGIFLAAAAQRSKRLRLGALVFTLSLYHPLRILEEVCMLDTLSGGRLDLGIGRGISPIELGLYGVDPATAQEIYGEVAEILSIGLTAKAIDYEGRHFRFSNVPVELRPVQNPIPRWYGAGRPETAEWAARNGINIVCNGPAGAVGEIAARFKSVWQDEGARGSEMPLVGMSRHVVVADTDAEAEAAAREAYGQWYAHLVHLWRLNDLQIPLKFPETFDAANEGGFCFVGSPATVRDAMAAQFAEAGISYLLCRMAFGNLPLPQVLRSVDLIEREIMPAFAAPHRAA